MKSYFLYIAHYAIFFESAGSGIDLVPSARFANFICPETIPDLTIVVHRGPFRVPDKAARVFHAPLIEEKDDRLVKTGENFWSVYYGEPDVYIRSLFPYSASCGEAVVHLTPSSRRWDLYLPEDNTITDPFEYPLDGLILYYLTAISGDVFIHASGVYHDGQGYLFSGISGKGKTTMACLWEKAGGTVIHDDRLIIRKISGSYRMFNTPVYNNDTPKESVLSSVFLIEHGEKNKISRLKESSAVSNILANCIQQNWNHEFIRRLMDSLSDMCGSIPVYHLYFRPDLSITNFLTKNE